MDAHNEGKKCTVVLYNMVSTCVCIYVRRFACILLQGYTSGIERIGSRKVVYHPCKSNRCTQIIKHSRYLHTYVHIPNAVWYDSSYQSHLQLPEHHTSSHLNWPHSHKLHIASSHVHHCQFTLYCILHAPSDSTRELQLSWSNFVPSPSRVRLVYSTREVLVNRSNFWPLLPRTMLFLWDEEWKTMTTIQILCNIEIYVLPRYKLYVCPFQYTIT